MEAACVEIWEVVLGSRLRNPVSVVSGWLRGEERVLLALDSPLGWPTALGPSLCSHFAGAPIAVPADRLFRRDTDERIRQRLGKIPLEVGANLIARTAHAALVFLEAIRRASGREIPMVWEPGFAGIGCVEVYPAATLKARGLKNGPECLTSLAKELRLPVGMPDSEHARDAVLCTLGGSDFLAGMCVSPPDRALAEREGWIWARTRDES
jgi:predicted nuclease with RNAse H fold